MVIKGPSSPVVLSVVLYQQPAAAQLSGRRDAMLCPSDTLGLGAQSLPPATGRQEIPLCSEGRLCPPGEGLSCSSQAPRCNFDLVVLSVEGHQ